MNAPMQSLAISLGVMQRNSIFLLYCPVLILTPHTCHSDFIVARKIPFDNPQVLDYVRIAYVASQAFALLVYYHTSSKVRPSLFSDLLASHVSQIKAKNDQTMLKYGVYIFFSASALSLIHNLYLAQSSQRIHSYVKVPLISSDLLKHV